MSQKMQKLDERTFDFTAFRRDLLVKLKGKRQPMKVAAETVCLRSENYLSNALNRKVLPFNTAIALCTYYGLSMKDYEIKPEPPKPVYEKPEEVVTVDVVKWADTKGWSNTLSVNMTAGIVSLAFFKDGEKIASGRAKVFGNTDHDIMQAISYAAHMCYKFSEQRELFNQNRENTIGGCTCKTTSPTETTPKYPR